MKLDDQWVLTVMKSPLQFSCNCNYSLIMHIKTPVHSTWGLLTVCAACRSPCLNLSSELCSCGNNIQDTFPTGSVQDTTVTYAIVVCHSTFVRDCHHVWNECNWFVPRPRNLSGSVSKYNTIPTNNLIYQTTMLIVIHSWNVLQNKSKYLGLASWYKNIPLSLNNTWRVYQQHRCNTHRASVEAFVCAWVVTKMQFCDHSQT
jgi:hypothetical protein